MRQMTPVTAETQPRFDQTINVAPQAGRGAWPPCGRHHRMGLSRRGASCRDTPCHWEGRAPIAIPTEPCGKAHASRRGRALWRRLVMGVALACLWAAPACFSAGPIWFLATTALAAKPPLNGLAVFPFTPQRGSEKEKRLSEILQQEITRSVLRWGRVPVLTAETSALWQQKLGLKGMQRPKPGQLAQMGVQAALHGTVQRVAGLALLKVRLTGYSGSLLLGGAVIQRFEMETKAPGDVLDDLLHEIFSAIFLGDAPQAVPQPPSWDSLWRYRALRSQQLPPDSSENHKILQELRALENSPSGALDARAALAQAQLLMEHAMLDAKDAGRRKTLLNAALNPARRATAEEPWNVEALALKGEIHYFLRQEFEARREASVARVKNPLSGLAYAVLGLAAGLSTGEASINLRKALALNPFLRAANRPKGAPVFQNGVLEPIFARWEKLVAERAGKKSRRKNTKMNLAIALFEQKKWSEAEDALIVAAEFNEYSHQPELYLARILIETGDSHGAVERLGKLVVEFPQEVEVYYYYGIALENSKAYVEAMDAFQRTLAEKPGDERALFHLGTAAMGRKDWSRALDALRLLLSRNDQHAEGWLNYGIVNVRSKQWQAADDAFARALGLKPGWEEARRWRSRMKKRLGKKP